MDSSTVDVTGAREHFALNKIAGLVESYQAPASEFDPNGNWSSTYTINTLLQEGAFGSEGELTVERVLADDGGFQLRIDCHRSGRSGFAYRVHVDAECSDDALSTPRSWNAVSKIAKSVGDPPYMGSGLVKKGTVEDGALRLVTGSDARVIPLPGHHTLKWCLVDATQRLPGAATEDIEFSLVDEFDQVRSGQCLSYMESAAIEMNGTVGRLTAYQHLGAGVIPTVYWVDEDGRLLFIMTGQEVYVLKTSNGATAQFSPRNTMQMPLIGNRASRGDL
jgi:hypothetical protein